MEKGRESELFVNNVRKADLYKQKFIQKKDGVIDRKPDRLFLNRRNQKYNTNVSVLIYFLEGDVT